MRSWGIRSVLAALLATSTFIASAPRAGASGAYSYSIWSSVTDPSVRPNTTSFPDSEAVELGVKFRADLAGTVTGVRFYKGAGNTGTHVGHLWTSDGALLASVTFANETTSGWQSATFANPVAIAANTTYVISYFAPNGHYSADPSYFAPPGGGFANPQLLDNPPLHALADGVDGANGEYSYGPPPSFPSEAASATNYWVDVVFDTTLPAPTVTSQVPAANATNVGLSQTVNASFSQQVQLANLDFRLADGQGNPVSASLSFDAETRTAILDPRAELAPGTTYSASVSAVDLAGTPMSAPILWSFTTTATAQPPPAAQGQWEPRISWPVVAIASAILPTGKVMSWDESVPDTATPIFDPDTHTFSNGSVENVGYMCGGQVHLADGRIMLFGGNSGTFGAGITTAGIYDPSTDTWKLAADMHLPRFYPSGVRMADGRIFVISGNTTSGSEWADTPEIYDPAADTWTLLPGIDTSQIHEALYPSMWRMADGRVFVWAGSTGRSFYVDVNAQTITEGPTSPVFNGVAVQYAPGKILVAGGTAASGYTAGYGQPAVATTAVIDLNAPAPTWRTVGAMHYPRAQEGLVTLADGRVMAVGGAITFSTSEMTGILPGEIWDPATETWTTVTGPMQDPRMNHSSALLLPDGRVLAAGGGHDPGAVNFYTGEIYAPPYLFTGPRPTISSAPPAANLGGTLTITTPNAANIAKVSLNALGAVTHQFDDDAVYGELSFTKGAGVVTATMPTNPNVISPADYYLTIVDNNGVPSVSKFLHVGPAAALSVTDPVPSNVTATSATLSWSTNQPATSTVQYGPTTDYGSTTSPTAGSSQQLTGLLPGTLYHARVESTSATNEVLHSNDVTFTTADAVVDQTINFPAPGSKTFGQPPFALSATATSGLPVAFSTMTPLVCTAGGVKGATITLEGAGNCTVQADQGGNASFHPAPAVQRTFSVARSDQTIDFAALAGKTYGHAPFDVTATATSGLAVDISTATPLVCTANGTTITILAAGNCTVHADQPGNANYNPAPTVSHTFSVERADQTIAFGTLANQVNGVPPITVAATASSGLAVAFSTSTPLVCTAGGVNGATITVVAIGTCTVIADQPGNSNINAAPSVQRSFTVLTSATAPDPPFGVHASPGSARATVAWTAPSANGSPIESYTVTASPGGKAVVVDGAHTIATVTKLTNGVSYAFRVTATNAEGTSASSTASNAVTPRAPSAPKSGYWMLGRDGRVYAFGNAVNYGSTGHPAVALSARSDGRGYWIVDRAGFVRAYGKASYRGGEPTLKPGEAVTTMAHTPNNNGYWLYTNLGRAFAYGDAHFYGDMRTKHLNGRIVASVVTPTGHGYYMVGSDGGVFAFGDAVFRGSTGGKQLNAPIVGISPTPDNRGYWLAAADGGVFAFHAPFRGSLGNLRLNKPVNGITAFGKGYLLVASDGGVFVFSNQPFYGSLGNRATASPIVGIAAYSTT